MIDHETEVGFAPTDDEPSFGAIADELLVEHQRLVELSERCRQQAESSDAREQWLREREESVEAESRRLSDERRNLELWRSELEGQATQLEQARQTLVEAAEREAALAALGRELVDRFAQASAT